MTKSYRVRISLNFSIILEGLKKIIFSFFSIELEQIDDETDAFGVDFVKINDKRLAKQFGIKNFPALTYFRYMVKVLFNTNKIRITKK